MEIDVEVKIDTAKILSKQSMAQKIAQEQLDQQVLKDSNYYVPEDKGTLVGSGIRASLIGSGAIKWDEPYAARLYYNPQYNFSKDRNPNARGLWFEAAKSAKRAEWLRKARKTYGKYFNGR